MTLVMRGWFRMLASAFKSAAPAQTIAGLSVLAMSIYTGYTIPRPSMIGALKWITYINPLRYGFEAVLTNEFHSLDGTCSSLVPQGPGYENAELANQVCTSVGSQPGQRTVDGNTFVSLSYGYNYSSLWMSACFPLDLFQVELTDAMNRLRHRGCLRRRLHHAPAHLHRA
jgi:ATP-binding cassette subfamily G (WHITE) protein 2 (SNQ2)